MTKDPINLADWVQFLISQKQHRHTWLIGYTTSLFVLLSIILLAIFTLWIPNGIYVSIPLFCLFALITILAFDLVPTLKKAKILLDDIMKENNTDVERVRDEWFEEEKMWDKIKKVDILDWLIVIFSVLSFLFMIAGFIVLIIALDYVSRTQEAVGAFGFSSFGLALFSIGVAFLSVSLVLKSDKKMRANATEYFLRIIDVFEDKRIQFFQHPEVLGVEGTIYKCKTYLDRALLLKKSYKIDEKYQDLLFQKFETLVYYSGLPWKEVTIKDVKVVDKEGNIKTQDIKIKVEQKSINVLLGMCSQFWKFDLDDEQKKKLNEITDFIKKFKK